ncbi:hypothetical protein [Streptomyces sp. NPDC058664]|uniref:hypothetical protein n=1 Tax=unclassified Streptomyces TaxID=2593676 RepID=UPI00365D9002
MENLVKFINAVKSAVAAVAMAGSVVAITPSSAGAATPGSWNQGYVTVYQGETKYAYFACPSGQQLTEYKIYDHGTAKHWGEKVVENGRKLEVVVSNLTSTYSYVVVQYLCKVAPVTIKQEVAINGKWLPAIPGEGHATLTCPNSDTPYIIAATTGALKEGVTADIDVDRSTFPNSADFHFVNQNYGDRFVDAIITCSADPVGGM